MKAFDKYFSDSYELVDIIKSDEKNFVATAYDKNVKRLCVIKKRNLKSINLYKILKDLNNLHIPKIYRIFEHDENLIVIEEHIEGQTLEEILNYKIKKFDEKLVTKIFLQICECLLTIHEKNIIHRDLTPSNIMLTKENSVKIIDFGIARIFDFEKISDTEFLGTRGYAAPEQYGLFDLNQSDSRTDIFNLGVTIKKLLGENYHGRLEKILNRCTNLNPELRYKSVSDLIHDIKRTWKIFLFKRIFFIFTGAIIFLLLPQLIIFKNANVPTTSEIETAEQKNIPNKKDDVQEVETTVPKSNLDSELKEKLIDFAKNPPTINSSVHEIPALPEKIPEQKPNKKSDRVKLFLYINGKLTENRGEHTTSGDFYITDFQNWQVLTKDRYSKYFLFPSNWTARLKIENFTDKDLITPKFTVSFSEEKIFIDKPTIKSGTTIEFDIPIANKRALKILGEDNIYGKIYIKVQSPSNLQIPILIRDLEVK